MAKEKARFKVMRAANAWAEFAEATQTIGRVKNKAGLSMRAVDRERALLEQDIAEAVRELEAEHSEHERPAPKPEPSASSVSAVDLSGADPADIKRILSELQKGTNNE